MYAKAHATELGHDFLQTHYGSNDQFDQSLSSTFRFLLSLSFVKPRVSLVSFHSFASSRFEVSLQLPCPLISTNIPLVHMLVRFVRSLRAPPLRRSVGTLQSARNNAKRLKRTKESKRRERKKINETSDGNERSERSKPSDSNETKKMVVRKISESKLKKLGFVRRGCLGIHSSRCEGHRVCGIAMLQSSSAEKLPRSSERIPNSFPWWWPRRQLV